MSDNFDRSSLAQDPLGDRLRAFGSAHAGTAHLPPVDVIHRTGDRRRRNQRFATAGVTLAAATIIGGVVFASQLGTGRDGSLAPATQPPSQSVTAPAATPSMTSPSTSPSASGTPSGTASTTPDASAPSYAGTRTTVIPGTVTFTLPEGWTVTSATLGLSHLEPPDDGTYRSMCLEDGQATPDAFACDLKIDVGAVLPGEEGMSVWEPGQKDGWYSSSGAMPCPVAGGGAEDVIFTGVTPTKAFAPVGPRTAESYRYEHSCDSGRSFAVTQYWLPTSQIRITDHVDHPRTSDILGSFRFN